MIKVIKKSPVTFHGVDCIEFLLEDDSIPNCTACDLCIFSDSDSSLSAACHVVHGCGLYLGTYFQIVPLSAFDDVVE